MPNSPVLTSDALGWSELKFSGWEGVSPQEAFEPVLSGHLIVIHQTPQPVRVFERADGYRAEGVANQGNILHVPSEINGTSMRKLQLSCNFVG